MYGKLRLPFFVQTNKVIVIRFLRIGLAELEISFLNSKLRKQVVVAHAKVMEYFISEKVFSLDFTKICLAFS